MFLTSYKKGNISTRKMAKLNWFSIFYSSSWRGEFALWEWVAGSNVISKDNRIKTPRWFCTLNWDPVTAFEHPQSNL